MNESDLEEEYHFINEEVKKYVAKVHDFDNIYRRKLYSKIELLKLDVEEVQEHLQQSVRCDKLLEQLNDLAKKVPLVPVKRTTSFFTRIEIIIRFIGVASMFIIAGSLFSLPILVLRVYDIAVQNDPFNYVSENLKKTMLYCFLYLSGIELQVEGIDPEDFSKNSRVLLSFTHASNLDGFLVAYTCPIRQVAFGKKELFIVPFFAWISLAIGGIPVDRGNRNRAVGALKMSVSEAKQSGNLCVAIAPEGTRSTTGQLLPYKKGAFYLAEDLDAPIVPLLIFGAYDLYPVGNWVNNTGVITVRYLPPIFYNAQEHVVPVPPPQSPLLQRSSPKHQHTTALSPVAPVATAASTTATTVAAATAAVSKAAFLRKVRRDTLKSLANPPQSIGRDISATFKALSLLANLLVTLLTASLLYLLHVVFVQQLHWHLWQLLLFVFAMIVVVTVVLYVYYVYLIHLGRKSHSENGNTTKSSSNGSGSEDLKKAKKN